MTTAPRALEHDAMDWQTVVAIGIVVVALVAGGVSVYRALAGKGGCGTCGRACGSDDDRPDCPPDKPT